MWELKGEGSQVLVTYTERSDLVRSGLLEKQSAGGSGMKKYFLLMPVAVVLHHVL